MTADEGARPILVKRYAGRRLYDTTNRSYVSVEQLRSWVVQKVAFSVLDSETGIDVTTEVLA